MPQNITTAAFVLGAVLLLISLLGGGFKIFGAEVRSSVSGWGRVTSFILGVFFLIVGLFNPFERTLPSSTSSTTPSASPSPPKPSPSSAQIDISGTWVDNFGTITQIVQQGDTFQATASGTECGGRRFQSSGGGTVRGNIVESSYQSTYSRGRCQGTVSTDGSRIVSTCDDSLCDRFQLSSVRQRE